MYEDHEKKGGLAFVEVWEIGGVYNSSTTRELFWFLELQVLNALLFWGWNEVILCVILCIFWVQIEEKYLIVNLGTNPIILDCLFENQKSEASLM